MPEGSWARVDQTIYSHTIVCRWLACGLAASTASYCVVMPASGSLTLGVRRGGQRERGTSGRWQPSPARRS